MWALAMGKVQTVLGGIVQTAHAHPVLFPSYLSLFLVFVVATLVFIGREQGARALWFLTGAIVIDFFFSWGDDTYTHVYRIAALADQVESGMLSSFLLNPDTGEGVPTFVYYSLIPYLLPALLDVLGLPALYAFKIVMALHFVVLAAGVHAVVLRSAPAGRPREKLEPDFFVGCLFLCANYVYVLWVGRASLGEVWVYCFVPWVVWAAIGARSGRALTVFLFLQICGHPIVLAQSLVAEGIVALSLARIGPVALLRRSLMPGVLAIVLATPFWLPQALWQDAIQGPKALPVQFADSFLGIGDLLKLWHERTVGLWLPLAAIVLIVARRARLPLAFWGPAIAAAIVTALETTYLFEVTRHVPTLDLSLFVWRLAFPVGFMLFGALLTGWREEVRAGLLRLPALAACAVLAMTIVMLPPAPVALRHFADGWDIDQHALAKYERLDGIWGVREYWPNYTGLPEVCNDSETTHISYRDLRDGFVTATPYVMVRRGPVKLVDYIVGGQRLQPAACGDDLVLGPIPAGARVTVSESRMNWLNLVRGIGFLVALVLMAWAIPLRVFAPRLLVPASIR
jgi:hypothetical protein